MALVKTIISNGIKAMVDTNPSTTAAAAAQIAALYNAYALTALAGVLPPALLPAGLATLTGSLTAIFTATQPSGVPMATVYGTGCTAFWLAPPVIFAPGVVTAVAGTAALIAQLTMLFSTPNDKDAYANGLADALDTFTKTVVVTIPPGVTVNLS